MKRNNMFVFIIPRVPKRLRNPIRFALYRNTIDSLLLQKSKNWVAIVLGNAEDSNEEKETSRHFIHLEADDFPKVEKLKIALDYLEKHPEINAEYLIRLDADDIINPEFLAHIERIPVKYDLYCDSVHVCIDPIFMKVSYRKNPWVANTAIHKYEHAIKRCGPQNEILFLQDHNAYWHLYYADKKVFRGTRRLPLYYRVLTPFSITSQETTKNGKVDWKKHLSYLNSYGPWIPIKRTAFFYKDLEQLKKLIPLGAPKRSSIYWLFNRLKDLRNVLFNLSTTDSPPTESALNDKNHLKEPKVCTKCLLSSADTYAIQFDDKGVCSYCHHFDNIVAGLGSLKERQSYLAQKVNEIKKAGRGKEYDCVLGVSGGVDSTYLAYWAKSAGLRPLIVHFDNGWDSELAVENIRGICEKLGFSLQTYVINWDEFRQLQLAYLRAGVIDIEALTDHAIIASIYKFARKYDVGYILSGFNYATEAIMPKGWVFDKLDFTNISDINEKFGTTKIRSFPHMTFLKRFWYSMFLKIETIQVLNYLDYNKDKAKALLMEQLGWRDYGGKHFESVFTKFYQSYILPVKFGVDKRKAHLSNLICSGQITKQEALKILSTPLYDEETMISEKAYVVKKLGINQAEFERLMREKPRRHEDFKTQTVLWERYFSLIDFLRPWRKFRRSR